MVDVDAACGREQLARRADVDPALFVEREVGAREGAAIATPDGAWWRNLRRIIKHGNQIANDASLARFGVPDTPDHHPHKVGDVFRAEFLHNVGTMKLDRARADIEGARCFPAGGATHNLSEHYSFARRQ